MKTIAVLFFVLFFLSASGQYVFTGNGPWSDAANWQNGLKAPGALSASETVSIQGTVTSVTSGSFSNDFFSNRGTVTVETGGSLTINNTTQFMNQGTVVVNGTCYVRTVWENYPGANFTVNGNAINQTAMPVSGFTNKGKATINNGGKFTNEGRYSNNCLGCTSGPDNGILIINSGGIFENKSIAFLYGSVTNNGTLVNRSSAGGVPIINGDFVNEATIAPGSSPGIYTINGNYSAAPTSVHNFEVNGTGDANYDQINATGTVSLAGTLNVSLINDFLPSGTHSLPLLKGTISGRFGTINLPAGYSLAYRTTEVLLNYGAVLPVRFVSIEAKRAAHSVVINWKVADEENVQGYEVEKSTNGIDYTTVGFINASARSQYSLNDYGVAATAFYRVKSLDHDGKQAHSAVVQVAKSGSPVSLLLFPVPAQNSAWLQHPAAGKSSFVTLVSLEGRVVLRFVPKPGTQQSMIQVSTLAAGIYTVQFEDGSGNVETTKLVKQ